MRLVTWNCCRGAHTAKLGALAKLSPDVAIVQECARPDALGDRRTAWFGDNPKQGVAVLASSGFEIEPLPSTGRAASAYTARIAGGATFNLLAIWAQRTPTYARAVLDALEQHRSLLLDGPSVVAGDFNTSTVLTKSVRGGGHADIVRVLSELGLVSAYHHFFAEEHGRESRPTHYFQWSASKPFHIDYCFVPRAWAGRIRSVAVGTYADWATDSDHRPLVVDVADEAAPLPSA